MLIPRRHTMSYRRLKDVETTSCVCWVGILCKKRYEQSLLRWGFTCDFKRLLHISRKTFSLFFADRDNNFLDYWILFAVRTYLFRVCSSSFLVWIENIMTLVSLNNFWLRHGGSFDRNLSPLSLSMKLYITNYSETPE